MKLSRLFSYLATVFPIFVVVNSEPSGDGLAAVVTALPPCAVGGNFQNLDIILIPHQLTCLVRAVANSTCSPTDQACVCSNKEVNEVTTACVLKSCTLKQGLSKSFSVLGSFGNGC